MAIKRTSQKKSKQRKPFWESFLERILSALKKLLLPVLAIWLIGWLSLGGIFQKTSDIVWNNFVKWSVSKNFVVKDIIIEGRNRVSLIELQKNIIVKQGDALLGVDVSEVQQNIEKIIWIKSAVVSRNFNGFVTVLLEERIPFVLWDRIGRGKVVIDTSGEIIKKINIKEFKNLLVVRGVKAPNYAAELMLMIKAEPEVAKYIKAAEWVGNRRWDLITSKNTKIHLPENDIGYSISRLAKSHNKNNLLSQSLLSIDLRGKDRIIIETERGKSRDLLNLSSTVKMNII